MAKKKFNSTDQVTHPFPKKGSRRFVKFSYREYLIEENPDQTPSPLLSKEEVLAADTAKQADQEITDNEFIKESDGVVQKPPKGWIEIKIPLDGEKESAERRVQLGKFREKGYPIDFRCFANGEHIYWAPKECAV
jgi:hypothetical protein